MLLNLLIDKIASIPSISRSGAPIGPIVGAIIGALLLLILGVAIAVIILYLVRRRSTGGNYSTGKRASEQQQSTENWDSKLDMEQNVAYESSNTAQISLGTIANIAYYESRKSLDTNMEHNVAYGSSTDAQISLTSNAAYSKSGRQLEENDYENDLAEYDYI